MIRVGLQTEVEEVQRGKMLSSCTLSIRRAKNFIPRKNFFPSLFAWKKKKKNCKRSPPHSCESHTSTVFHRSRQAPYSLDVFVSPPTGDRRPRLDKLADRQQQRWPGSSRRGSGLRGNARQTRLDTQSFFSQPILINTHFYLFQFQLRLFLPPSLICLFMPDSARAASS